MTDNSIRKKKLKNCPVSARSVQIETGNGKYRLSILKKKSNENLRAPT